MKVLLVFANLSVRTQKADPEQLKEILESAGLARDVKAEVYITYARSLSFFISNEQVRIRDNKNHMNLDDYDFVYFRKAGAAMQQMLVCAHYLRSRHIPFFDTELLKTSSRNKLSQMYFLQEKGLPIPKTLFCRNNKRLLRLVSKRYAEHFAFPLIAKATGGTRGDANYLVQNIDELSEILTTEKRHFLIQEYIPNEGDYRFFIGGGVLRGVIKRKGEGDSHLNNTSKGGSAELVPVDSFSDIVRSESVYAAALFGRDIAGVDVMFDSRSGQHYFLEVNRAPQIEGASFEKEKGFWMMDTVLDAVVSYQPTTAYDVFNDRPVIGRFESVYVVGQDGRLDQKIVAKVDTGADSSSIHCTDLKIAGDTLSCRIGEQEFKFEKYFIKQVKPSTGEIHQRYLVEIPIRIGEKDYYMKATLSNRSSMKHDMLIGRRFLRANSFVVDVSRRYIQSGKKKAED